MYVDEWLYFYKGTCRAIVFIGDSKARTFYFAAGDTAVFPDNSGRYTENTSDNKTLVWLDFYKSDQVVDISLAQWLALTLAESVANMLKIDIEVVKKIKEEK
ncbi:hypothetical protein BDV19DRAFT_391492 [Aspergillus venezuelensis]